MNVHPLGMGKHRHAMAEVLDPQWVCNRHHYAGRKPVRGFPGWGQGRALSTVENENLAAYGAALYLDYSSDYITKYFSKLAELYTKKD